MMARWRSSRVIAGCVRTRQLAVFGFKFHLASATAVDFQRAIQPLYPADAGSHVDVKARVIVHHLHQLAQTSNST